MRWRLSKSDVYVLLYGAFASFGLYFCMYAFRKPFTVATFENLSFLGINFKVLLILTQVMGYMLSKFIGIRVVSGLDPKNRPRYLAGMVVLAELALILFGIMAAPYNFIVLFINGLALGIIWGVVFSYLEGRKLTEMLGVILCSSFIVSSGAVKSVGLLTMNSLGVSEFWMPAVTGGLFLLPFFGCIWLLEKLPPPTEEDKMLRKERKPMTPKDRKKVVQHFFFPITILVLFYIGLTALRDFRDNFSREIWDAVGFRGDASIYTLSELPIAILVLVMLGLFGLIKNNYQAFMGYHYLLIFASIFIGASSFLFQQNAIGPVFWMINIGLGLYVCYVPFNCIFFDRMIATFRINGNAGYLIYISDAFGYLGSMAVLLYKNFGQADISWLHFFTSGTYIISGLGCTVSVISLRYFVKKSRARQSNTDHQIPIIDAQ